VRVREFEQAAIDLIKRLDHPEIINVEAVAGDNDPPTKHTRLKIDFAGGDSIYVMVQRAEGPGISRHPDFELPREAL